MDKNFWKNRRVLVTGHTGFKGSWLCLLLKNLDAELYGFALPPAENNSLYGSAKLSEILNYELTGDIRDPSQLENIIKLSNPEIIFHLAAQPLVGISYEKPIETFDTNIMGLVKLFEVSKRISSLKVIINVTSDKCYLNEGQGKFYEEGDILGGADPYSASKACAELISQCYSKMLSSSTGIKINTARAGNVIGGGDFTKGRLLPDCMRAIFCGDKMKVRNLYSTRPWQHALEPLSGYLLIAENLFFSETEKFDAWNFGPNHDSNVSVIKILEQIKLSHPKFDWEEMNDIYSEAHQLGINSEKSKNNLGWSPKWNLEESLVETLSWYEAYYNGKNMQKFSEYQLEKFLNHGA